MEARRFTPAGSSYLAGLPPQHRRSSDVIFVTVRECTQDYGAGFATGDTTMDLRKIDLRTAPEHIGTPFEAATIELSEEQLSSVCGGKGHAKASAVLMSACATGVHLREATITH